ncbi:MAG: tetratricopeptide repeat protein [Candidatus Cloacimonadales bacterium]|nr:tetratricopeptide repeat protein [Candidatus Cloacimonadales bacterium]
MLNYNKALSNLKGLKYYENKSYEDAEKTFGDNSIQYPNDARLHYNQGNALYKKGELEQAENSYNLALKDDKFADRSLALQNLGNVKFQQKDYKNAIKDYRDALIADPDNLDARYNYELAARMLQRQQEQKQQQQQNQDENKDKKDKEKQQQQQNQQDQEKKEKQKQEQMKKDEEQKPEEQQKTKEQKAEEKEKEDADKILKALLQKEKEEMKKEKQKMNVDKEKKGKYW